MSESPITPDGTVARSGVGSGSGSTAIRHGANVNDLLDVIAKAERAIYNQLPPATATFAESKEAWMDCLEALKTNGRKVR